MKKIILLLCIQFFLAVNSWSVSAMDQWNNYIDGTVGKKPYYLYEDVINKLSIANIPHYALDLGSGAGNEDVDLLSNGWHVTSVDTDARSGEVIEAQSKLLSGQFHFIQSDFNSINWTEKYGLVISFFSLPFGKKFQLPVLISNISRHTISGGIFAANFFGNNHTFVKKGKAFGITKEELTALLTLYHFEIIYLLNRNYDQKDFSGEDTHWDIIDVVAVKKA